MSTWDETTYAEAAKVQRRVSNLQQKMQSTTANASWAQYSQDAHAAVKALSIKVGREVGLVGIACDNADQQAAESHLAAAKEYAKQASAAARKGQPLDEQPAE